jgi:hypothetical protein
MKRWAASVLNWTFVLFPNLFAYALLFVINFKAISACPDNIVQLGGKGTHAGIMPQHTGDVGHSRSSCMMPRDEWLNFSVHQNERRFCQAIDRAEHALADASQCILTSGFERCDQRYSSLLIAGMS